MADTVSLIKELIAQGKGFTWDNFSTKTEYGSARACTGEWLAWAHKAGQVADLIGNSPASAAIDDALKMRLVGYKEDSFARARDMIVGGLEGALTILEAGVESAPGSPVRRAAEVKPGTAFI